MDIFEILGIEQRVKQAKKESPDERYARIVIPLDNPEYIGKDIWMPIDGDYLAKIKYNGSATGCYFKFGTKRSSRIYAAEFRKRHTPFVTFPGIFLTNPVSQSGKEFIVFVGGAFSGEIEPSTGEKVGLTDSSGADINAATEDGNLETIKDAVEIVANGVHAENAVHHNENKGNLALAVRKDMPTNLSGLEGDYEPLQINNGSLHTLSKEVFDGRTFNLNVTLSDNAKHAFTIKSRKLKDIIIKNVHATQSIIIGKNRASVATMRTANFEVIAGATLGFTKIDLHTLYYVNKVNAETPAFQLIGTIPFLETWDISTAVYLQNFSVAGEDTEPRGLFFKPDGSKVYVIGSTGDDINEYDLSTAWDISTAVYSQNFSVAGEDTDPRGLFFKPDGSKVYVIGSTGDDINEYDLSTAWDISTAVYSQNFSVAGEDTDPQGLFFKPDGSKVYVIGSTGDDINEYDLSTAWDISTAVYSQNFSVAGEDTDPQGLFFKPDGSKVYVIGSTGDDINEYDLSTAWDISTAVYSQNFSVAGEDTDPQGLFFKPDGSKVYVIGSTGDDINEYEIG